jgi:formylglycine-generating enzyme required for sulfatase activity
MSDPNQPKLELQISSPQALVRRMDQQLALVERLLAEAESAHALVPASLTNSLGMKMLWCPPGEFLMGSPEDENQVQVQISKGFWMARTPVTQGQWQAQMGNNPSHFKGSKDLPVEKVSWNEAVEFCDKLNAQESLPSGYRYALPTEAQWEYACRAGTTMPFHFGSTLNGTEANCNGNYPYGTGIKGPYLERTTVVGSYHPNAWGLYDMHGNVWEWCENMYDASGSYRVLRGGSWLSGASYAAAGYRPGRDPGDRRHHIGFRLASVPA